MHTTHERTPVTLETRGRGRDFVTGDAMVDTYAKWDCERVRGEEKATVKLNKHILAVENSWSMFLFSLPLMAFDNLARSLASP